MNAILAADSISVTRNGKQILKDVSVQVGTKDFITVIGPNGAGKSMLLKCMLGFYQPDSGKVHRQAGLKANYVPQRLNPDHTIPITVKDFIGLRKKASAAEVVKVAEETGIENKLGLQLSTLSDGELQRVLLSRSLLEQPELLVLDEPAQNLDLSGQLSFYRLLDKIYQDRGISILMVSHDLHMVMASTKKVLCLFHHVCCSGEPHMVAKDPEFIELFGKDMARMMAVYQHSHSHSHDGDTGV
ncbi:MAG: ATP-binding cassette domain-containing protein [Candidatus Porifericomitaceae bacterium WSBS_2022_MAG_OTU9]